MKFEIVRDKHRKFGNLKNIDLPVKGSTDSAGYDFKSNEFYALNPNDKHIFWTDIKAKLNKGTFLLLVIRSSVGIKQNIRLANTIGIVDSDYYGNKDNDGNIGICLHNYGDEMIFINRGDRIAQGIVVPYESLDNVNKINKRIGGFGSTGK